MAFPSNPENGDTHTEGDRSYMFDSSVPGWRLVAVGGPSIPANIMTTDTNQVITGQNKFEFSKLVASGQQERYGDEYVSTAFMDVGQHLNYLYASSPAYVQINPESYFDIVTDTSYNSWRYFSYLELIGELELEIYQPPVTYNVIGTYFRFHMTASALNPVIRPHWILGIDKRGQLLENPLMTDVDNQYVENIKVNASRIPGTIIAHGMGEEIYGRVPSMYPERAGFND